METYKWVERDCKQHLQHRSFLLNSSEFFHVDHSFTAFVETYTHSKIQDAHAYRHHKCRSRNHQDG